MTLVTFRLPMPEGLSWNTAEELLNQRDVPRSASWTARRNLLIAASKVYVSGQRRPLAEKTRDPTTKLSLHGPATHYDVTFAIAPDGILTGGELRIIELQQNMVPQGEDARQHKPTWRFRLEKETIDKVAEIVRGTVDRVIVDKNKDRVFVAVGLNVTTRIGGAVDSRRIKGVRLGLEESNGTPSLEVDHRGERLRADQIEVAFRNMPEKNQPVFIRIDGIDGWIKCAPLKRDPDADTDQ